ncbi:MAG: HAD family hydrolase [Spirochaetales bacterium]|nr:MAG: HAD family hydrolase [Spirochaetales bacterium]
MNNIMYWFIDFDGVICDSRDECFTVSLAAYEDFKEPAGSGTVSLEKKERFDELRPFIRNNEDFLYLHYWLDGNVKPASQAEFDSCIGRFTEDETSKYTLLFYEHRNRLLSADPDRWYALNPLYPGFREVLLKVQGNRRVHILSSKRPDYISLIFEKNGLHWPADRIHFPGKKPKLAYLQDLSKVLREREDGREVRLSFIDDQKDHFTVLNDPGIDCFLASWGYIQREWLAEENIKALTREDFLAELLQFGKFHEP